MALIGRKKKTAYDPDSPVLPTMLSSMYVDVAVNEDGLLYVVYDRPLLGKIHWMEFDRDMGTLTLVMQDGKIQDFGMPVPEHLRETIAATDKALFAEMNGKDIKQMFPVTVVVRDTVH